MANRVSLFIGCLCDLYHPRVGVAITKILEHFGCIVDFPQAQTCCGRSLHHDGYATAAKDLAQQYVEIFRQSQYIITPSPACCVMVREQYPILLEDAPDWEVGGWKTAGRTYEFVEFLTTVLKVDLSHLMLPTTTAITCHLPCQMRSLGSPDQTPRIVRNMRNVEFRQLDDTDRCCGAGAGLPMKQPEIARTMAAEKVAAITATGAQVTVCNEPLCTIQITAAGRRTEWSGSTKHIAELLAEAMEIDLENR